MQGSNLLIKIKKGKDKSFQGEDRREGTPTSAISLRREKHQDQKYPRLDSQKKIIQKQFKDIIDPIYIQQDKECDTAEMDQLLSPWESKENMKEDLFNTYGQEEEEDLLQSAKNFHSEYNNENKDQLKKFILPSHQVRPNANFPNSSTHLKQEGIKNQVSSLHQILSQKSEFFCDSQRQIIGGISSPSSRQGDRINDQNSNKLSTQRPDYSSRDIGSTSLLDREDRNNNSYQTNQIEGQFTANTVQEYQTSQFSILPLNRDTWQDQNEHIKTDLNQEEESLQKKSQLEGNQLKPIDSTKLIQANSSPRFIHISDSNYFGEQKQSKKYTNNIEQFAKIQKLQKIFKGINNREQNDILISDFLNKIPHNIQNQFKLLASLSQNPLNSGGNKIQNTIDSSNNDKFLIKRIQSKSLVSKNMQSPKFYQNSNQFSSNTQGSADISPEKCIFIKKIKNFPQKKPSQNNLAQSSNTQINSLATTLYSQDLFKQPQQNGVTNQLKPKNQSLQNITKKFTESKNYQSSKTSNTTNTEPSDLVKDLLLFKQVFPKQKQNLQQQIKSLENQSPKQNNQRLLIADDNKKENIQDEYKIDYFTERFQKSYKINNNIENQCKVIPGFSTPRINTTKNNYQILTERQSKSGSAFGINDLISKNIKYGSLHISQQSQQNETERSEEFKKGYQVAFQHLQIVEDFIQNKEQQQALKKSKLNQNLQRFKQHLQQKKEKQEEEKNIILIQAQLQKQCTEMLKNIMKDSQRKQHHKNIQFLNKNNLLVQNNNNEQQGKVSNFFIK